MKNGPKGKGAGHASYISAEGKYEAKSDLEMKFEGNLPEWADSAQHFFKVADQEERANGRTYKEFEISLPRELNFEQNKAALKDFFVAAGLENQPYLLAMHKGKSGDNPHAHLMFSERPNADFSPEQFFKRNGSKKDRSFNDKSYLSECRQHWESACNKALASAGVDQRVDSRSLKEQGIDRLPQPKIGYAAQSISERGGESSRLTRFNEVAAENEIRASYKLADVAAAKKVRADVQPRFAAKEMYAALDERKQLAAQLAGLKSHVPGARPMLKSVERMVDKMKVKPAPVTMMNELKARYEKLESGFDESSLFSKLVKFLPVAMEKNKLRDEYAQSKAELESLKPKLEAKLAKVNRERKLDNGFRKDEHGRKISKAEQRLTDADARFHDKFGFDYDSPQVEEIKQADFDQFELEYQADQQPSGADMEMI